MAGCDITKGRCLSCKDAVGGLKAIYFVNHGDLGDITYGPDGETITSMGVTGTPTNAYKYELHLGNDLTQNIMSSAENGTLFFEQLLNLTLKKLSAEDNAEIRLLAAGHPHVIVEDQMGNFMVVGTLNGADVTGGTAVTGNAMGDLNGYTLTLTANERALANFYTGDLATEFAIVECTTP